MVDGGIEKWDLTSAISPYLDRHMLFPLLDYLDELIDKKIVSYAKPDIAKARLDLLTPTHMIDYAMEVAQTLPDNPTKTDWAAQKELVVAEREALQQATAPLEQLAKEQREKLMANGQWNLSYLMEQHNISPDVVESYLQLARYNFDCGDYESARQQLAHYIDLHASAPTTNNAEEGAEDWMAGPGGKNTNNYKSNNNNEKEQLGNPAMYYLTAVDATMLSVLWGRLAAEILHRDWEAASVAVEAVKTALERCDLLSPLQALQQRTWLLHWSLFVYWNEGGRLEQLVELFQTEKYKQAITTNAPHLLRYLTAAVVLCKRRVTKKAAAGSNAEARKLMKNLIYVMQDCEYMDPIVEFVDRLCVKFDFDSAQTKLAECEKVLAADFFLCHQTALFMEEARVFVFENYCRIHHKIDLQALGEKLAMDQAQAERWMVDLIRNADLDAKIDSEAGCVIMGGSPQNIYEQVMDRTRDLNVRSATLVQNMNNLLNEYRKEKVKKEHLAREDY